jgi:NAD(P)H-dependent FMN reductase
MVKVLVSLDDNLLRQIDRRARRSGLSRSAYLAQLAARDVAREKGPGATPAAREALSRLDALFAGSPEGDATAAIREERNRR